jgi:uncharacterized protein (DUF1810 family)
LLSGEESDPYNLKRFLTAQENVYSAALAEIRSGRKRSHWMWFIFPQIEGLGRSEISRHYAIKNRDEAIHFLMHPVLGQRLIEISNTLLAVNKKNTEEIFRYPDHLKFKSCMTLFAAVAEPGSVFQLVLNKFFNGEGDPKTMAILGNVPG